MVSPWQALADNNRRKILLLLRNKEMTPTEIARHFDFTLPAVSSHLRVLRDSELVSEEKHGKNRFYSLNEQHSAEILKFFEQMWGYNLRSLKEYIANKEKSD